MGRDTEPIFKSTTAVYFKIGLSSLYVQSWLFWSESSCKPSLECIGIETWQENTWKRNPGNDNDQRLHATVQEILDKAVYMFSFLY